MTSKSSKPPVVEAVMVIKADDPYQQVSNLDGVRLPGWDDADVALFGRPATALIVDTLGVPLDMGRKIRLATPDQRTALGDP